MPKINNAIMPFGKCQRLTLKRQDCKHPPTKLVDGKSICSFHYTKHFKQIGEKKEGGKMNLHDACPICFQELGMKIPETLFMKDGYKVDDKDKEENNDCFTETGVKQLNCGHFFHGSCIKQWFKVQKTCPMCRKRSHVKRENPRCGKREALEYWSGKREEFVKQAQETFVRKMGADHLCQVC